MPVPSHSPVVAYLALFVCRDAIGSKEIKDNTIQSRVIKNRAIALTDISKIAPASLKGQRWQRHVRLHGCAVRQPRRPGSAHRGQNRTANFQPVLALGDGAVVRDLSVVNTATTIGARGIDGQTSEGTHVERVAVEAPTGILLRSARQRDASVTATAEGLRIGAPLAEAEVSEVVGVDVAPAAASTATI